MNSQVNNPLYQQFVELVNTTSSGVIEQCVEPLSKTLSESQKEISRFQLAVTNPARHVYASRAFLCLNHFD